MNLILMYTCIYGVCPNFVWAEVCAKTHIF